MKNQDPPTTGHPAVDAVDRLFTEINEKKLPVFHFPANWSLVLKEITDVLVLSEIVYWHRPAYNADGTPRKKFSADLYHLRIPDLAQKLGVSRDAIRCALVRIEDLGLIKRIIRYEDSKGRKGTYCFIELFVDKLHAMTFLETDPSLSASVPPPCEQAAPLLGDKGTPSLSASVQKQDSRQKTPKENTDRQGKSVGLRPADSNRGATPPEPPAGRKPSPVTAESDKLAKVIEDKQAEFDRLKEEHDRLIKSDVESDEDYLRNKSQRLKVTEQMSDLSADLANLKSARKAAREQEQEEARADEMLTPESQAAELAKVVECAPKMYEAHFGQPLPEYDRSNVSAVLAQLVNEGSCDPALEFLCKLALAWRRIGAAPHRNGHRYDLSQRTRNIDHFCKHLTRICETDIADYLKKLNDIDLMADWLIAEYDEVVVELCSVTA
jgi:hypothetical protein